MNKTWILLLLGTMVSCGKHHNKSGVPAPQINPEAAPLERPLEITQRERVDFLRKEQWVSRYNCKNELVSRKIETTNSLSKTITIDYPNRKNTWSYSVRNRRTNDSKRGAFKAFGKFTIDYAPTVFNMRVKEGINDIEYTFYHCPRIARGENNELKCAEIPVIEKEGIVQIDVYYSSVLLPGEQHLYESPEYCKRHQ